MTERDVKTYNNKRNQGGLEYRGEYGAYHWGTGNRQQNMFLLNRLGVTCSINHICL